MVWLLNSQGIKSCKSTESFCLSILTIYVNDFFDLNFDIYCCHVHFFSKISKYVYGSGAAHVLSWFGSMLSETFLQMKFIIFQSCPTKQVAFLYRHMENEGTYVLKHVVI